VDSLRYKEIANDAKKNQQINTRVKPMMRDQNAWKPPEGSSRQRARSDQNQAPVQFRLLLPIHRESEWHTERHHVEERNNQKLCCVAAALLHVQPTHRNSGRDTDYGNSNAQDQAKPPELPVKFHISRPDQGGLDDKKQDPTCEDYGVKVEDYRPRRWWVDKTGLDCATEAVQHNNGHQQGHEEIEGMIENAGMFCPKLPTIG